MPHLHTFTHLHPALCTVAQQNPSNLCKLFLKKQQECLQSQFQEADYLLTFAFQMSQVDCSMAASVIFQIPLTILRLQHVATIPCQIKIVQEFQNQAPGNCYLLLLPLFSQS